MPVDAIDIIYMATNSLDVQSFTTKQSFPENAAEIFDSCEMYQGLYSALNAELFYLSSSIAKKVALFEIGHCVWLKPPNDCWS